MNKEGKNQQMVAEGYERLYQPLPESVSGQASVKVIQDPAEEAKEFLQEHLPRS